MANEEKKIIIFGAGDYGRRAFEFFGTEKVAYFVDNNPEKSGKEYCGKEILSFNDYLHIYDNYRTVIAVKSYEAIALQLREAGVKDYQYYSIEYQNALIRLSKKFSFLHEKALSSILFVGIDATTDILYRDAMKLHITENQIVFSDTEDSGNVGTIKFEKKVSNVIDEIQHAKIVVISSSDRAYELQVVIDSLHSTNFVLINPFVQEKYYETTAFIYNPYQFSDGEVTEDKWNDFNINKNDAKEKIRSYTSILNKYKPFAEHIEIETVNRCNGKCTFCPVSAGHDTRTKTMMSEELFRKLIGELADINYSGRLALFSNNEPLLDPDIISRHQYARKMLPNARMHLFTNGSLLTIEKFVALVECLDELIIDNYNQDLSLTKPIQIIYDYCENHRELAEKVTIVLRKQDEILTSRGGDAPNRNEKISFSAETCALPFKQMIIRPDGKVSLCCNDPLGRMTLGDLTTETISEVWYGEPFTKVRKALLRGRGQLDHCRYCDTFILF